MTDSHDPHEGVGYKRPPKATQFKPGQSGNARGRPKGAKDFATVIQNELTTRIVVTENGKRKTISKREAVAKQLVNKAASGDSRAIPILLNEARAYEARDDVFGVANSLISPEDEMVMQSILQRIRFAGPAPECSQEALPDATAPEPDGDPSATGLEGPA
jgi:hypothetical protein